MLIGRTIISITLISSFFLAPVSVIAQSGGTPSSSQQVVQRFNPNATIEGGSGGRTFSGLSFSGVGGAIAGCSNLGGKIKGGIGSISGIFKNKPKTVDTPAGGAPPVPTSPGGAPPAPGSNTTGGGTTGGTGPGGEPGGLPPESNENISEKPNAIGATAGDAMGQSVPVVAQKTDEELKKTNERESCLNGVAYAVAKGLLRQVTDKTLSWVETGGVDGSSQYIKDITSTLRTVSDKKLSSFLGRIPNQNPIFGNALRSIVTEQLSGISDGKLSGVMDTPEGRAYDNFQKDFTNGGWKFFLDPEKNGLDAIYDASDQLSSEVGVELDNIVNEVQRSEGFLDMKVCAEEVSQLTTLQQRCLDLPPEERQFNNCPSDSSLEAAQNAPKKCLRYETTLPGILISRRISETMNTDIRQLEQADQINEVLGSFFDQLLNRLLSGGLGSLRGRTSGSFSFSGTGNNLLSGTTGGLSGAVTGATSLGYQQAGIGVSDDFDVSRPQHMRAVVQTQRDYLNRLLDARASLNRIVPTLGALDYCVPGPNPTWKEGLEQNANTYFSGLQIPEKASSNTGSTIGSAAGAIGGSFIPGVGTAIGAAIGGLIGGLFDGGNKAHGMVGYGITLFDKVTQTSLLIRDTVYHERNRSPEAVFNNIGIRWTELMTAYNANFTQAKIADAFASVDSGNAAFARGFVASSFEETANLPEYAAAAFEIDAYYETSEAQAREAIVQLEAIRLEADAIVAIAKTRYIAEQASAGTPVNRACIDTAYVIDTRSIVPVARQESSTPSPFFNQFIEANNYFYSTL